MTKHKCLSCQQNYDESEMISVWLDSNESFICNDCEEASMYSVIARDLSEEQLEMDV